MAKDRHKDRGNGKHTDQEPARADQDQLDKAETSSSQPGKKYYEKELARLSFELVKLQYWVMEKGLRVVILFEGRDAAGKGGLIQRIIAPLNPRGVRHVALSKPSDVERTQWYFQRYV